jgi:hypothetical protein
MSQRKVGSLIMWHYWVLGPESNLRPVFDYLQSRGKYEFNYAAEIAPGFDVASAKAILLHVPMDKRGSSAALKRLDRLKHEALVVVFSDHEDMQIYLDSMWRGSFDYFTGETPVEEISRILDRAAAWSAALQKSQMGISAWSRIPSGSQDPRSPGASQVDSRNVIETLKAELEFLENGGYRQATRRMWKATSLFEDSPICINFAEPGHTFPCSQCLLIDFVPPEHKEDSVPCHHIPLNERGDSIDSAARWGSQEELEGLLKEWLRNAIRRLEADHAHQQSA